MDAERFTTSPLAANTVAVAGFGMDFGGGAINFTNRTGTAGGWNKCASAGGRFQIYAAASGTGGKSEPHSPQSGAGPHGAEILSRANGCRNCAGSGF